MLQEKIPEITEDCFLTALEAQDFHRDDGSADDYLVIFENDEDVLMAYPVPRMDRKKNEKLKRRMQKAKSLRKSKASGPHARQRREEAEQIEISTRRDRRNDQHERYTRAVIKVLDGSGVSTVVIGNGPPALDRILERQAAKRELDIVHVVDNDEAEDVEEQVTRLLTIDLLARVMRQHELAGHPKSHLCFGCVYEAMREATQCLGWYGAAYESSDFELSFDVCDLFLHAIRLTLWKLLGFEPPPKKAHERAVQPLIEQIIDGGDPREFGAIAQVLDHSGHGRADRDGDPVALH